jgi:hypothetical protein
MACGRRLVPWILGALVATYAPALAAQALISGLSDLQLGRWNGTSDMQGEVTHCVYAQRGGRFSVAATGVGSGGAFVLRNGPRTLSYRVDYNDGSGWRQLNPGVPLSGQRGEPNLVQLAFCLLGQRPPERVRVRVLAQDLAAAPAGSYNGLLSLLITPE